ncbi:MAG TPA: GerMN domain-containing protein [Pyrinomonadaceae bacterium]
MKSILLAALAFVILWAAAPPTQAQQPPLAGGYGERSTRDRGVAAAAAFAVRERGRRTGRRLTLLAVRRAETQVVAGLNYRLLLSVREGRAARDVTAVVHENLRRRLSLESWEPAAAAEPTPTGREVKVFLVALDDRGRRGRRIGCDDSLVPVTRNVIAAGAPLKAAVEELLALPREYEGGLRNFWAGENLRVQSAVIAGGVATIRILGTLPVAGVCDQPRIEEQINATARQFRGVRSVRVFLNGQRLARAIS